MLDLIIIIQLGKCSAENAKMLIPGVVKVKAVAYGEYFHISNLSPVPQIINQMTVQKHGTSSHSQRGARNTTNIRDLYDSRLQKYHPSSTISMKLTCFLNMSKALRSLPKFDQTKIKLDLHTARSQAEIHKLQRQERMITPINVALQIISQQQQEFQPLVQKPTSIVLSPT